ncbi:hypothetical protein L5515_018893 [Caenorhabditis briggsae]|uniref:Uncharacterized protein n=1 Tax=Caenorhabditis briggsae TaxID=6238 RepID=A0AAE9FGW8_CAEBR|nr:hypothetical protein L5515_018893 [Caenorhabditis briggsae]
MNIPLLSTLGLREIVLSRATEKSKVINVEQKMLENIMTPKRNESENETDMFLFNNEMLFKTDVRHFELSEDNIRKINTLEVHSLKINCETNKYQDEHHYNIIRLLEDCLNSKSREQLAHLTIEGSVPFQATWFRDILELFPNLKSFVRENAFHLFFPPLPFARFQLVCLDLSNNRMRSLKGVSQLPNLEVLVMRNTQLENASDYDDLFLLSKLKYLDVSRATKLDEDACHTLGHLVERNMSMVSLKHIDCANLRLNYRVLATLLSLNPAIKSIVLYGTLIHDALDPNVKVLAAFDLKSSVSLLDHYYSLSRETMVQDVLMEIREFSNISNLAENVVNECATNLIFIMKDTKKCETMELILNCLANVCRQHLDKISSTNKYEMITFLVKSNLKPKESFCYIVSQTELLEIPELDKKLLFRKSLERIVYMWGSESYDLQEFTAIVVMMECSIDSALTDMSDAIREKLSVRASLMSLKLGVILYRFCLLLDVATEVEEIVIQYLTILRTIYETIGWQIPLVQLLFESLPKALNHTATAWGILKVLYLALPHIHRNVIQQKATFDLALVLLKLVFQDYSYFEDNDVFYENDVSYFAMYLLSRMFHPRILKRWKRDLVLITINFVEAFEYERFFIMWLKPNGIKWREVSSCQKAVVRTFKMLKFKQMRIKNMDDARIGINEDVSPKLKQIMFDQITYSHYIFHSSIFTIFSVNEIDLTSNIITENHVQEIAKCDFKTLKINCSLKTYQDADNVGVYDIVGLIKACVNPETRKKLETLKVATKSAYRGDWMDTILRYLPNLQTLVCKQKATTGFPPLSMTFPQLKSLDVSCISLSDINGISCLINLETLIMRNLTVSVPEDLHELFALRRLKHLDVSRYQKNGEGECKTIEYLVQDNKVLPKLEFIDFSYLHITDVLLRRFLMLNKTIQKICLFGTDCENIGHIDGVTVLTSVDLRASLKLLDHFYEQQQFLMVDRVFQKINGLIIDGINYNKNQELLNTCFKTFVHYIDNVSLIESIARTSAICAIMCSVTYCTFYNQHMTRIQRSRIAQVLLDSRTERAYNYWWLFNCAMLHTVPEFNVVGYFQRVVIHISNVFGHDSRIRNIEDVGHGLLTMDALYPRLDEAARRQITEIPRVLSALQAMFDKCSRFLVNRIDLRQMYHIFKLICTVFRNIISGWNLEPEEYEINYISLLKFFERVGNHNAVMPLLLGLIEMIQNRIYYKKLKKLATYSNIKRILSPTGFIVTNDRRAIGLAAYTIEVFARSVTPMRFRALRPHLTRFCVRRIRVIEWTRIFVPQCRLLDGIEVFSIEEVATPEEWATVMFDRLEEYIKQVYEHHQETRQLIFQHFGRVVDTNVKGTPLFQIISPGEI